MKIFIRKLRFGLRFLAAFWQEHRRLIVTGAVIGVACFLLLPRLIHSFMPSNTQSIGLVGKFAPNELPLEIQRLISSGLTSILPNGEATPSLAANWEASKEGREYLFTIRDDAFWQTGEPVLAEEINYNFNDVAPLVIGKKQIKFELKDPFTPFPVVVSRPVFQKGLIGAGEYQVSSVKRNGQIIEKLVLSPAKDQSKPSLIFRFYPTETAARTAFKLGEVDTLTEINHPRELENWGRVKITAKVKNSRFVGIFFDTQSPKFGDKSTRQALAYAIHKRWEPRALNSTNPHCWAYNANVKPYDFDLSKAQELWQKRVEEGQSFDEIELATIPSLLSVAEAIKSDWEQLEVKVKIRIIDSLTESFETLLITQEVPPDPDQYALWHSTQPSNVSQYKSPKLDKLLEDGRKTLDQEERKEIYYDFQRFLVEDTPVIFLFHPTVYEISRK